MALEAGERRASREELEVENATLRMMLARAGIDSRLGSVRSAKPTASPRPEGSDGHAEIAAALDEVRRARNEASEASIALARSDMLVGALRGDQARLRSILETIPVGILLAEAPSGRITDANGRVAAILGHPPICASDVQGYGAYRAFHADGRIVAPEEWPLARIIRGETDRAELEVQYQRPDGRRTWITVTGEALTAEDGTRTGAVVAFRDIDDRKAAEAAQDILNRELSHRLKNTLALVQSIAAQTLRNAASIDEAQESLAARLIVLGKAHDILLEGQTDSACVAAVVRGALALHEDTADRFRLTGPSVLVGPSVALSLGLILHELATNATKYGALSQPDGSVDVAWSLIDATDAAGFRLEWTEQGGPAVAPPSRKGFGTRLIERGFAGGQVSMTYRPEGVTCTLTAPLTGVHAKSGNAARSAPA